MAHIVLCSFSHFLYSKDSAASIEFEVYSEESLSLPSWLTLYQGSQLSASQLREPAFQNFTRQAILYGTPTREDVSASLTLQVRLTNHNNRCGTLLTCLFSCPIKKCTTLYVTYVDLTVCLKDLVGGGLGHKGSRLDNQTKERTSFRPDGMTVTPSGRNCSVCLLPSSLLL